MTCTKCTGVLAWADQLQRAYEQMQRDEERLLKRIYDLEYQNRKLQEQLGMLPKRD